MVTKRKKKEPEIPAEPEIETIAAPHAEDDEEPEADKSAEPLESSEEEGPEADSEDSEVEAEDAPDEDDEDDEDASEDDGEEEDDEEDSSEEDEDNDVPAFEPEEKDEDDAEEVPAGPAPKLERLQKILAQAGVASRRHAEELITGGRVEVNGETVIVLGTKADPARDHIRVDGKLLQGAERQRYFMLHKPKGYVTTVSDPEGRPTVMEFFTKMGERVYPVGRLDYLSEGLLLVTNDGELANALTKASSKVDKTYLVKVSGQPTDESLDRLREGVAIDRTKQGEGKVRTAPARIRQVREGENPWFEVVLIEGRNRELRKMFEEIGHHVEKIRRVGYGPLVLDVPVGKTRPLDPDEIQALRLTAAGKLKPKRLKTKKMLPKDAGKTVVYEDKTKPRAARPFGTRPPRAEFGQREDGFAPKREGSFAPRTDRPARREGGFAPKREGFAPRREGSFAPKREGGFAGKREGGFAPKREGSFGAKREGGFAAKRPGGFARPDKPFRPAMDRTERPAAGEGRGFAPRGEESRPSRGGNPRFGRPEGGRTSDRRDDRGFRPDDRPQKSFRPSPAGRPFARPAAPRHEDAEPPRSFTPRTPSRLRIDAVDSDPSSAPRTSSGPSRPPYQRSDRPSSGRPSTGRPGTGRPSGGRPSFDRPSSGRPSTGRPSTGRPTFDRPWSERPPREGQERPSFNRSSSARPSTGRPAGPGRPSGTARPPRGEGSSRPYTTSSGIPRAGGARPSSKPRPAGKTGFGSKPRPSGGKSFGSKPGGFKKPGGFRSGPNKGPGFKGKPGGKRG